MNIESFSIFGLVLAPFLIAFLIEAVVLYFFKLKGFWASLGLTLMANLVSIALVFYGGSVLISTIGYSFNGLDLQPQVISFFCWASIIVEGLFLTVLLKAVERKRIFSAAIVMNVLSYGFLWFFIVN